ncbi:MAG TPA: hypothetical protein PLW81_07915 [Thiobacillaceae bacterium]|nr:hypothetical protein [Thiobacillaceae bacterium]
MNQGVTNFPGFPLGVTSCSYNPLFNLTLASSFNPAFVTNNGGTPTTPRRPWRRGWPA